MAQLGEEIALRHLAPAPSSVRLVEHAHLAAAVAGDTHEPRREKRNGSLRACSPIGNGSAPSLRQCRFGTIRQVTRPASAAWPSRRVARHSSGHRESQQQPDQAACKCQSQRATTIHKASSTTASRNSGSAASPWRRRFSLRCSCQARPRCPSQALAALLMRMSSRQRSPSTPICGVRPGSG